jgi:phosphate transport system substrate-binding protein
VSVRLWRPAAALLALLGGVFGTLLAGVAAPPPAAAIGAVVTGTGSSYAAVAINQWVGQVEQLYGDNINYQTQSSVIGLNYFAQGQVNFGASEIGYSSQQANSTPPAGEAYQYMPDVAGAICLMYNLVDQTQQPVSALRMNPQVLFGIFSGQVRQWNDPALQRLNPSVLLPNAPIIPVYRSDASGDNYILSDYFFTLMQSQWNSFENTLGAPAGPTAVWPTPQSGGAVVGPYNFSNFISQNGSDNASNYVNGNGGSVTYVETAYAIEHHRPCVQLENNSGAFLAPSEIADAIALQSDKLAADLEQDLTGVYLSSNPAAYPISAYSYLITEEGEMPAPIGAVLGQFVKFLACRGQQAAGSLGYAPIPPNLVQDDFEAIARMNGAAPPGPLNVANCPNPYLLDPGSLPGYNPNPGSGGSGSTQVVKGLTGVTGPNTSTTLGPNGQASGQTGANGQGTGPNGANATGPNGAGSVKRNSTLPPAVSDTGQVRGIALLAATNKMSVLSGPTGTAIRWTLLFALVVVAVPVTSAIRRRRRGSSGGAA